MSTIQMRRTMWFALLLICWAGTGAVAQPSSDSSDQGVYRRVGGWQPSPAASEPTAGTHASAPQEQIVAVFDKPQDANLDVVQTAFFQTQGVFPGGPPVLPTGALGGGEPIQGVSNVAPPLPSGFPAGGPNLPAGPGNGGGTGGFPPPPQTRAPSLQHVGTPSLPPPGASLPTSPPRTVSPPQQASASSRQPTNGQPSPHTQNNAVPQNNGAPQAMPSQSGAASPLRAGPNPARAGNLRAIQDPATRPVAQRQNPNDIATGPPFVTPPARGRYATSPYQPAVFQTAAYQTQGVGNTSAGQLVSGPTSTTTYLTAQQQSLPQFQQPVYQQPAIYPTSYQCGPPAPSFPSTGAVPGAYIPPTLPPNLTPGLYTPNNAGYSPIFSLGQENYNVLLGRGIIGQPTVYVPGQPIRNFMRYLSP